MAEKQVRVILWCNPRTVSTAFTVCMSNLENVQVINQAYLSASLVGPENRANESFVKWRENMNKVVANREVNCEDVWESEHCSYRFIKENILEAEYPAKKVVFVKDMSDAIIGHFDMLPKGYRHVFLIRRPEKLFPSFKRYLNSSSEKEVMLTVSKNGKAANIIPDGYFYRESLELYEHLVKTEIEPNPFIIDSDDLLENPESMLRQFCSFAGIDYTDKLLAWDDEGSNASNSWKTSKEILQWNEAGDFHKNAFNSKGFGKPTPVTPRSELSEDVLSCIDASLPYYRQLYELRATINQTQVKETVQKM